LADKKAQIVEGVGPYQAAPLTHTPRTPEEFAALDKDTLRRLGSISDSAILHRGAMIESAHDNLDGITIRHDNKDAPLQNLIEQGKTLPIEGKIDLVSAVISNNVKYTPMENDATQSRRPTAPLQDVQDYAQTVKETLTLGSGDCEDFAIAQGELLMRMGVPPENIQVMSGTVYDSQGKEQFEHANLAVKTSDNNWNILELVGDDIKKLPANEYLQNGLHGQYFVPYSAVDGNGKPLTYEVPQSGMTPKDKFEGPESKKGSQSNILEGITMSASNVPGGLSGTNARLNADTPQQAQEVTTPSVSPVYRPATL
jgi:hypothetical protein